MNFDNRLTRVLDKLRRILGKLKPLVNRRTRLVKRVMAIKRAQAVGPYIYTDDPKLSLIVLSFNHRDNVLPILEPLRLAGADELIVCDDGSIDDPANCGCGI